jgi:hypothetical protein
MAGGMSTATIQYCMPTVNMPPLGVCSRIAADRCRHCRSARRADAALCVPDTPAPWMPDAAAVMIGAMPLLDNTCTLTRLWA